MPTLRLLLSHRISFALQTTRFTVYRQKQVDSGVALISLRYGGGLCVCACTRARVCLYVCTCARVCLCVRVYTWMCLCVSVCGKERLEGWKFINTAGLQQSECYHLSSGHLEPLSKGDFKNNADTSPAHQRSALPALAWLCANLSKRGCSGPA